MCQNFFNFIICFYTFAKYLLQNKTWFRCKFLIDFSFNVSLTSTLFLRFSFVFLDTISFISLNNLFANWLNFFFHYESLCIILAIMVYCQFCFLLKMKPLIVKHIFIFTIQIWYKLFLFCYFKFYKQLQQSDCSFSFT